MIYWCMINSIANHRTKEKESNMNIIDGHNQEFALRLIGLRRKKKLTQYELAKEIGTDKRSISMYENGRTFPREDTLKHLAQQFDVDCYWLKTGQSPEIRKYLEGQQQKSSNNGNLLSRVELLNIESWDDIGNDTAFSRKTYTEKPTCGAHSSEIGLFMPVVKSAFDRFRAVALPSRFQINSVYEKGAIVTFDEGNIFIEKIPSGSDVIFRITGKENKPGLRKLIKEPGVEPMLTTLDSTSNLPAIMFNDINIEILGVVIGTFKPL